MTLPLMSIEQLTHARSSDTEQIFKHAEQIFTMIASFLPHHMQFTANAFKPSI